MPYICPVCGGGFQTRTFCRNCGCHESQCQCQEEADFFENHALREVEDDEETEDDGDDIEEESDEENDDDY